MLLPNTPRPRGVGLGARDGIVDGGLDEKGLLYDISWYRCVSSVSEWLLPLSDNDG